MTNTLILMFIMSSLTLGSGMFIGTILSVISNRRGNIIQKAASGFIAGIMIGIVVLEILPDAFKKSASYIVMAGTIVGLITGIMIDKSFDYIAVKIKKQNQSHAVKIAILFSVALLMHNFIEGIALGTMLQVSLDSSVVFGIALAIDNVIDGTAITVPIRQRRLRVIYFIHLILLSILLSLSIILGIVAGSMITKVSEIVASTALGFIAGFILLIILQDVISKYDDKNNEKMDVAKMVIGCIAGFLIIYILAR